MAITDWHPTLTAKLGTITGLAANGSQPHRVHDYTDLPGTLLEVPTGHGPRAGGHDRAGTGIL